MEWPIESGGRAMECKFVVGQKVVCIKRATIGRGRDWLRVGREYEITALVPHRRGIYLELMGGPSGSYYRHLLFRPAQEHKTNLSMFTRTLEPA
jgi:hypothetical protein